MTGEGFRYDSSEFLLGRRFQTIAVRARLRRISQRLWRCPGGRPTPW
jgi:hypothetical protein